MRSFLVLTLVLMLSVLLSPQQSSAQSLLSRVGDVDSTAAMVGCNLIMPSNPFAGPPIEASFVLPDTFLVTISILDTLSNPVYQRPVDTLTGGYYSFMWLRKDEQGNELPVAHYVFQLKARAKNFFGAELTYLQRFLAFP